MPQYDNPASFLPDPTPYMAGGQPNFMSGMIAGQHQAQAAPFLQELLKQQQMNTQRQGIDLQEYQGITAQRQREAQRQQIIDEGDVYNRTKEGTITIANEKARLAPYMTEQGIEEAKSQTALVKHQAATMPLRYFSGLFNILEKMPEEQRGPLYNKMVKESGIDSQHLDPDIAQWDPSTTMNHLAAARYAQVHTAEQEQKETLTSIPAEASKSVARINVAGRIAELNQQIKAGRFDNDQRMVASIEKSLRTGKDADTGEALDAAGKQELQTQLRRYKSAKLLDFVTKQTEMERMARMIGTMSGDPTKARAANDAYDQAVQGATKQGMKVMGLNEEDLGLPKKPSYKVGQTLNVQGTSVQVIGINPDGSAKIRDPETERTGTYRQ